MLMTLLKGYGIVAGLACLIMLTVILTLTLLSMIFATAPAIIRATVSLPEALPPPL